MSATKDDLGQEIPGEVWHTAMRFTGLAAAREIVRLGAANENLSQIIEGMRLQFDATADELRAQRDRAERLCQEHATLIKQLEERLRQATQPVDRSKLPTVPPQVGYRYERRNGTGCEIVGDYGSGVAYRFAANDGRTYTSNGDYGTFRERHTLDLVREIGRIEQGGAK